MRKLQILLLLAIAAVAAFVGLRLYQWNRGGADAPEEQEDMEEEDFDVEILDQIYMLRAEQLASKKDDGRNTILCLGNDTFAWNYENGLTKALEKETGARILNGAFPGSTVSVSDRALDFAANPDDLFSFYHIAMDMAAGDFSDLEEPVRAKWEENYNYQNSYETLVNTDYAALDTLLVYYDAADYLKRHSGYNPEEDKLWTDLETMTGAYVSGIRAIQAAWPHIRIILVTPALMFTYTPEGQPVSADRYDFGHGTLTTYVELCFTVGEACGVTVIDNYHGMTDEENSNGYMADTTHLSDLGNEALAKHIARVLESW